MRAVGIWLVSTIALRAGQPAHLILSRDENYLPAQKRCSGSRVSRILSHSSLKSLLVISSDATSFCFLNRLLDFGGTL